MDSHGNSVHGNGAVAEPTDFMEFPDPLTAGETSHAAPTATESSTLGYAPTGPTDSIEMHPKKPGYTGFGKKVWWVGTAVLAAILFAFAYSAGLFKSPATSNGAPATISQYAAPQPEQTALVDTKKKSNALPTNSTQVPLHGQKRAAFGPPQQSQNTNDGAQPGASATPPAYFKTSFGQQMAAGAQGVQPPVEVPNVDQNTGTVPAYPPQQAPYGGATVQDQAAAQAAAQAAQQQIAQQQEAARASMVVTSTTQQGQSIANPAVGATSPGTPSTASNLSGSSVYNGTSTDSSQTDSGPSYSIWAGDVLPAELDTGIVSDIPGPVLAHITQDVYDSMTGRQLLIPAGSRLIGNYSNSTSAGQTRMGIDWRALVLPNGHEVTLAGLQAADLSGNPGLAAHVDNHSGRVLKTTFILGGLAALSQLANPATAVATVAGAAVPQQSVLGTIASAQAQQFVNSGTQMIQRDQAIPPTLTVPKNTTFTIIVDKKVSLQPYAATQAAP